MFLALFAVAHATGGTSDTRKRKPASTAATTKATAGVGLARGRAATARRKEIARRQRIAKQKRARAARLRAQTPEKVICRVFGRHCDDALVVAHCESRFQTEAQNGQYLGLFQMGSYARELYGHGGSAKRQAEAAFDYFVDSGRDWSPWGCKP